MSKDTFFQMATEAEESLIKGILNLRLDSETATHISSLDPECFMVLDHQAIWKAFQTITGSGGLIDSWALLKILRKIGAHDATCKLATRYFEEAQTGYQASDVRPRVASVADSFKRRSLARCMAGFSERIFTDSIQDIERELAEVSGKVSQAGNPRLRAGTDYSKQFESFLSGRAILPPESQNNLMVTGVEGIDAAIVANPGRLIVIGALPSAGKTALAVQAAIRTAQAGKRVALGSLEMDEDEIAARIVACSCSVDSLKALKYGSVPAAEDRMILDEIRSNLVGLHGCAGDSWASLESSIIREHRRSPLSLAVIDYLQLLGEPETKGKLNTSEAQRIGEITKAAKRLAQRLRINVLLLSQFNREVKECEEPTLQNFLGSGQIERDIDIALLLWNTSKDPEPGEDRIVNCRIAKNRGGARYGKVRMAFNPALNQFRQDFRETDQVDSRTPRKRKEVPQ